jgi:hypothetical protein
VKHEKSTIPSFDSSDDHITDLCSNGRTLSVGSVSIETVNKTPDVAVLEARLHEIKDMDRSNLSKDEKRALREEVRSIRTELINSNQGVYISFGALVIIILLLVIIF